MTGQKIIYTGEYADFEKFVTLPISPYYGMKMVIGHPNSGEPLDVPVVVVDLVYRIGELDFKFVEIHVIDR